MSSNECKGCFECLKSCMESCVGLCVESLSMCFNKCSLLCDEILYDPKNVDNIGDIETGFVRMSDREQTYSSNRSNRSNRSNSSNNSNKKRGEINNIKFTIKEPEYIPLEHIKIVDNNEEISSFIKRKSSEHLINNINNINNNSLPDFRTALDISTDDDTLEDLMQIYDENDNNNIKIEINKNKEDIIDIFKLNNEKIIENNNTNFPREDDFFDDEFFVVI